MNLIAVFFWMTSSLANKMMILEYNKPPLLEICINNIMLQYTEPDDKCLLSITNNINIPLPKMNMVLEKGKVPNTEGKQRPDIYLINQQNNLQKIIKALIQSTLWNPKGKFLIISSEFNEEIFLLLNKYFLDRIVVLYLEERIETVTLFDYKVVGNNTPIAFRVGTCNRNALHIQEELFYYGNKQRLFPTLDVLINKIPPYYINDNQGHNSNIINIISGKLGSQSNFTKILYQAGVTNKYEYIIDAMQNREYDMFGGVLITKPFDHYYFDITFPVIEDQFAIALPVIPKSDNQSNYAHIFTTTVWVVSVLIIIIFYVLFRLIFMFPGRHMHRSNVSFYMTIIEIVFQNSTVFKPRSLLKRFLLLLILFFILIMTTAFRSKKFAKLADVQLTENIDSLEAIMGRNMTIAVQEEIMNCNFKNWSRQFLFNDKTKTERSFYAFGSYVRNHSEHCSRTEICLNKTAFEKDTVVYGFLRIFRWFIPIMTAKSGKHLNVHLMRNLRLGTFNLGFYFTKGHPIFEKFNYNALRLKQHGIIDRSYRTADLYIDLYLQKTVNLKSEFLNMETSTEFKHLYIAYAIGNSIAIIVFVLEYFRYI